MCHNNKTDTKTVKTQNITKLSEIESLLKFAEKIGYKTKEINVLLFRRQSSIIVERNRKVVKIKNSTIVFKTKMM